jgi:large subunit ribosomal protein L9
MSTQVILTAEVEALGAQGDAVSVADGYARNYLIPHGLAIPATPGNLKRIEGLRKKHAEELAAQLGGAQASAAKLADHTCTIPAAAGPDHKLFGSVTAADIAAALKKDGIEVERRRIALAHPLRELGSFEVEVKLHPEVSAKLKLEIVAAGEAATTSSAAESAPKPKKSTKKK